MSIIFGGLLSLIGIAAILAAIVYVLYQQKQKRINANVALVREKINKHKKKLENDGVESISKNSNQEWLLPKNEILFIATEMEFEKRKVLKSGTVKTTLDGFGETLISDKAITTTSNLASGKKRYLYKNLVYQDLKIERKEFGNVISFNYNRADIIMHCDQKQLEAIITAFYLKDNPIKDKNSISF